ncbi:MAG TPA: YhgE/Pip family protein [Lacisediminihabitans sp.]|jgi:putative membrane protein|nr:YhgE/Pip family protein [Lacisediminihabitans sp.]HXD62617.1 YhgE/Pip family protein [Lacisediminihabitans sp.]
MSQTAVTPRPRRWLRWGAVAAVVLIPLAFAGLFVSALANSDSAIDRIPAAIVNQDTLVYQTAPDGTKSPVFAGRQLVTELTGGSAGFDWTITNEKAAKKALADGSVYAILTVPKNFSSSILSLSSDSPKQAKLAIKTDDAHSYLTGALAQSVGDGMANTFGKAVTAQYISGLYSSMGQIGGAFSSAADGATQLSSGISQYTAGVDSLASGLGSLRSGASKLTQLSGGVATYTDGVSQLAQALAQANAGLQADPTNPVALATVNALSTKLSEAAAGGATLNQQAAAGISGIQGGISKSATGAAQLAGGSAGLRDGASSLASGLKTGASKLPAADSAAGAASAKVVSDPVGVTVSHDNRISKIGQVIATFFVPLGLWIGALAVFLVLRPVTRRALSSTAANGRLVFTALAKACAVTVGQALLLVALLHLALGVSWSSLPATLGFSVLAALAFTAFHYLLTIGLGRAGLVVSLFVLAVQVTSTGGLYPIQLLAAPFQWVSPLLPLTYGVQGMQGIIAGGDPGVVLGSAAALLGFGVASVLVALLAIRRTRRTQSLVLASPRSVPVGA